MSCFGAVVVVGEKGVYTPSDPSAPHTPTHRHTHVLTHLLLDVAIIVRLPVVVALARRDRGPVPLPARDATGGVALRTVRRPAAAARGGAVCVGLVCLMGMDGGGGVYVCMNRWLHARQSCIHTCTDALTDLPISRSSS